MRLAIFTKNRSNPAYAAARIGANRVAARFGASTRHYVPIKPDDVDEQIALVGQAAADGADALVIASVHPQRLEPALAAVCAAGIPLFSFVNRPGARAVVPTVSHIGADDAALAARMAEVLFEHLAALGCAPARVVALVGPADNVTSRARVAAFDAAAAKQTQVQVVGHLGGRYLREPAREAFAAWYAERAGFDAIWAANDVMALGALDVLRAASLSVPIVGVNAIPEAVAAIAAGEMLASADFNAMAMCALATECALRHARGEQVPAELMLPVQVVDRHNCARWALPYGERALPTLDEMSRPTRSLR